MSGSTGLRGALRSKNAVLRLQSSKPLISLCPPSAGKLIANSKFSVLYNGARHDTPDLQVPRQRRWYAVKGKEAWEKKLARQAALQFRRQGKERGEKRRIFHEWFDHQCKHMSMMDRKARQAGLPFQIRAMAVVERVPLLIPDREDWEEEFEELQDYLDVFKAVFPDDAPFFGKESENPADDYMTREQLLEHLPEGLKPMPRITEDDESGNLRTTNRMLAERVYLTIQENENLVADNAGRMKDKWVYPSTVVKETETMLDAVKRIMVQSFGEGLEIWYPSAAPMGVQIRIFKKEQQESTGCFGEKMFFYRIQYDQGDVAEVLKEHDLESKYKPKDFAWLTRAEMVKQVKKDFGEPASKFHHFFL